MDPGTRSLALMGPVVVVFVEVFTPHAAVVHTAWWHHDAALGTPLISVNLAHCIGYPVVRCHHITSHHIQVRPADDAATHPGRPPGSAVQPVRGRRTTASPSVPRVRASTV